MLGVTSRIVKIVDISLLTIFALSFGSSVWNTSLSGMLDNFAGYGSALFTLSSLLFAVYSMFPCCGTFPWMRMALFVSAAGCAICWFLNWQAGNAAMVCTGLNLFDSICTGSWMEYIFCALYVTSIVFQVLFALEVDGDGSSVPVPDFDATSNAPFARDNLADDLNPMAGTTAAPTNDTEREDKFESMPSMPGGSFQDEGEGKAAGDSEHDTRMHLMSKEQDDMEERIRLTLGSKTD
ncbi:hypothetical protein JCM8547_001102 [Rhodosporidiobolus lusitaniae]